MVIKDAKGMYILKIDEKNRIVYEYVTGYFEKDDYSRYHNDYKENILPIIGKHPWVKCANLKKYKVSDITEEMCEHHTWERKNGLQLMIAVSDNTIVKLQLKRKNHANLLIVKSQEEAEKHLKSLGYLIQNA